MATRLLHRLSANDHCTLMSTMLLVLDEQLRVLADCDYHEYEPIITIRFLSISICLTFRGRLSWFFTAWI